MIKKMSLIQVLENRIFQVTSAIVILGSAGAYYFYWRSSKTPEKEAKSIPTSQSDSHRLGSSLNRQDNWFDHRYRQVIQTVKTHFDGQNLNVEAIKAICQGQYTLAERDYKALIMRTREDRRAVIKNKNLYASLVFKADTQLEILLEKHLNAILARFNVPKDFWMGEIGAWVTSSDEGSEEWETIIQEAENGLIDTLRDSDQFHTFSEVKKILELKLKIITGLSPDKVDLNAATDQTAKFSIVDKYLNDMVWKEFKVEEENLHFSLRYLKGNQRDSADEMLDKIVEKQRILLFGEDAQKDEDYY